MSIIAQIKQVREKLILLQQKIGLSKNVVMDGRDIGTKVFPDAEIKFFVTADVHIRGKRWFNELISKDVSVNEILMFDQLLKYFHKVRDRKIISLFDQDKKRATNFSVLQENLFLDFSKT